MRSHIFLLLNTFILAGAAAAPLPIVPDIELQPLAAQVRRVVEALDHLGDPILPEDREELLRAASDEVHGTSRLQELLDRYCLMGVQINPESRVKVMQGAAAPQLMEQGWRTFLVKVINEAGVTAELQTASPNARSGMAGGWFSSGSDRHFRQRGMATLLPRRDLWFDLELYHGQPMRKTLSGLGVEYQILQLYSRDAGRREARIMFDVGQGTQDLGFRNEVDILFEAAPAREITLRVYDEHGKPTTACFVIRDRQGRVYPAQSKRLAPDFAFHPQVYRADQERIRLPEGEYTIEFSRGPESIPELRTVEIGRRTRQLAFKVARWIDPAQFGWWSGDHHIHAAGCAHYTKPTEGVHAPDMMRHCLGEDLKIGANLTWGPCFDYQKQFFTGKVDPVSQYPYLLRYDIEVSGFGSHQSGHLCLLRLKDQMYPGGDSMAHWPTLGLNTLRWAKAQGAVTGPAHSGWGLEVNTSELPNYIVPPFSGIGANEYIVDVTHTVPGPDGLLVPAVDFISMVDTPYVWELNIWYHTLNAGFRTRISGETDFPCIYGERVGLGRSYVKLEGTLDYDRWCEGLRLGRNYVGDGRSHLLDFRVNEQWMGSGESELQLRGPQKVRVSAAVAARLDEKPDPDLQKRPYAEKPYWSIERARLGSTREVPVEVLVNGQPVARQRVPADGTLRDVTFEVALEQSSWVALRILPSSHTNPIFVIIDGKPIRASRRSIDWCLKGVDQCWSQKERFIKAEELDEARAAYDHARTVYRQRLQEATVD
jgi:hypothetical protein